MSSSEAPTTVLSAIVAAISGSRNRQATLDELYAAVPKLLGRSVNSNTIRGTINRSLETRNKRGPYPILFKRVAPVTYALANN